MTVQSSARLSENFIIDASLSAKWRAICFVIVDSHHKRYRITLTLLAKTERCGRIYCISPTLNHPPNFLCISSPIADYMNLQTQKVCSYDASCNASRERMLLIFVTSLWTAANGRELRLLFAIDLIKSWGLWHHPTRQALVFCGGYDGGARRQKGEITPGTGVLL